MKQYILNLDGSNKIRSKPVFMMLSNNQQVTFSQDHRENLKLYIYIFILNLYLISLHSVFLYKFIALMYYKSKYVTSFL